jgi:D-xylose transport system ATP-binding protein
MSAPLLEVRSLTKRFPGVVALRDVAFELRPGEIHALCGENGAGKSTLIKLLAGIHPHGSYEGEVRIDGHPAHFRSIRDAEAAGIAVITQEFALVDELSIAENIFLGREPRRGPTIDWLALHRRTTALLREFDLHLDPATPVRELGIGQKQLLEILRALDKRSRILVLDEPTAALPDHEVGVLLAHLRRLRERGTACIYISHKLDEVFTLADRITVLRDGQSVATEAAAATSIPRVIAQMVGREITDLYPRTPPAEPGPLRLKVDRLSVARQKDGPPFLQDISFELRAGEVLGLGGLMGAGRTELLMHLFGAWGRRCGGTVQLGGSPYDQPRPSESIRRGLVLASEDRRRYGLVLPQSVGFNLSLSSLKAFRRRGGSIDTAAESRRNQHFFSAMRIKAPDQSVAVSGLSGGGQQKVVLGKALMTEPRVVLLDEPTRGIDVGAKLEVYELINRLTHAGQAVLLASSELPELMGLSDRIIMLAGGRIGGVFRRSEFSPEKLLAAAMNQSAVTP